ncbi:hypothetical protein BASA81_014304 [Batrachochytrium salamandrivorans]|nr:hypothetical protein BASA62_000734 [Batrachochytrium salamandrivorans]KAH9248071.1 hypothetical protein BASA81_014304 [Batrachochytrium salamandrivorans]
MHATEPVEKVQSRLGHQKKELQDVVMMSDAVESGDDLSLPIAHRIKSPRKPHKGKTTLALSQSQKESSNAVSDRHNETTSGLWRLAPSSGGKLNDCRTLFSQDSRYFFTGNGSDIKMFSVSTGVVVRTLESVIPTGSSSLVVSVVLDPHHATQVIAAYSDGLIALWDHSTGALVKKWITELPLSQILMNPRCPYEAFLVIRDSYEKLSEKSGRIQLRERGSVIKFELQNKNVTVLFESKKERIGQIDLAVEDTVLVVSTSSAFFLVDHSSKRPSVRKFETPDKIVTMAVNPAQPFVATGDSRGRIKLWYCFNLAGNQKPISSLLHWHAHQVNDLAFTPDGTILISGGDESVLVLWQLETGNKQFFPRMGSEILSIGISSDQMLYSIGHKDNCVRIVSAADMSIKQEIAAVKSANVNHRMYPMTAGLVVDPRSASIAMNGYPGSVQFYNPALEQSITEVDVSPRNRVTRIEDREILRPHVHHIQFSDDGEWMATVDVRNDRIFATESYLRFWKYNTESRSYVANTRVDSPHGETVTSLRFQPRVPGQPLLAATSGADKLFKIWEFVEPKNDRETATWVCRSTGFYKSLVPMSIAFSKDGGVMAVACGSIVTLWDPFTSAFKMTLVYPPASETITKMTFVHDQPFLVVAAQTCLHVWNVLTGAVVWSLRGSVSHLLSDSHSSHFIALIHDLDSDGSARLALFTPSTPVPELVHKITTKCHGVAFTADVEGSRIVYLDADFRFQTLFKATNVAPTQMETVAAEELHAQQSLFTSIYGGSIYHTSVSESAVRRLGPSPTPRDGDLSATININREEAERTAVCSTVSTSHALGFLEAPSHIVAAPSKLVDSFMEQFLIRRAKISTDDDFATHSVASHETVVALPIVDPTVGHGHLETSVSFLDAFFSTLWVSPITKSCNAASGEPVMNGSSPLILSTNQGQRKAESPLVTAKGTPSTLSAKTRSKMADGSVARPCETESSTAAPILASKSTKESAVNPVAPTEETLLIHDTPTKMTKKAVASKALPDVTSSSRATRSATRAPHAADDTDSTIGVSGKGRSLSARKPKKRSLESTK